MPNPRWPNRAAQRDMAEKAVATCQLGRPRRNKLLEAKNALLKARILAGGRYTFKVYKATCRYENALIDVYLKHGTMFYKSHPSPRGTPSPHKCKPYRWVDHPELAAVSD